ncbi:NAD-dependent epimerase/dehydratase family protein [Hamadaea tsunoensis]|uniref:NAD-dependent epimerase/dehydratase family protein n=1 Tax=Hamadaea tsunoensis TaxID=53368 RepID=UPI0004039D21|nr:NAD(P)-dependent oxidoreductase [Hamadaea tsunoensis]
MSPTHTVVITGAAGKVGRVLRTRLARPGRVLRLLDVVPAEPPAPGEAVEVVTCDVTDENALEAALAGASAIIHLGGQSRESSMEDVLHKNAYGSYRLLEAARRSGIDRIVLASSNHAAGFYGPADAPEGGLPADVTGRPDTVYGWSKVAIEALGSLYADRYGLDVLCVRIGMCMPEPKTVRGLAMWLSQDDAGRLFEACLTVEKPGYRIVWGVSDNTRGYLSLSEGEAIGYHPQDDSETFAAEVLVADPIADDDPQLRHIGGEWTWVPLGEPY